MPSGEGTGDIGLLPRPLERISQRLAQEVNPDQLANEMLSGSDRRANAEIALALLAAFVVAYWFTNRLSDTSSSIM